MPSPRTIFLASVAIAGTVLSQPQGAVGQASNSDWDDINEFLSGVKFEVRGNPDPAQNYVKIADMPQELLNIGVQIPILGFKTIDNFVDKDSEFAVGDLECDRFALKGNDASLDLDGITTLANGYGQFNFHARGISARCTKGTLYVKNFQLVPEDDSFFGCLFSPIECTTIAIANAILQVTFTETGLAMDFTVAEPGTNDQKVGLDLNNALIENIDVPGKSYKLPERLRLPSCTLLWNQGLINVESASVLPDFPQILTGILDALLRFIVNALVSAYACPVIQQFGMMNNPGTPEAPGYASVLLASLTDVLISLPQEELRDVEAFDASVEEKVAALGVALADVAVLNDDNLLLSAGRLITNDILGSVNNRTGTLTINELMSALTDNTGRVEVTYERELSAVAGALAGVAKDTFGYVSGLNKFTQLSVLDTIVSNDPTTDPQLKYTLKNNLTLSELDVGLGSEVVLIQKIQPPAPSPSDAYGAYVTATKPLELRLDVGAVLGTPNVGLTTTQAFMPDELMDMPFGNLISPNALSDYTAVACAAQSLLFLNISDVEIEAVRLNTVKISGVVDAGLDRLLQQSTGLLNGTYADYVSAELGNVIRANLDFVNEAATTYFTEAKDSPDATCPIYNPANDPEPKDQQLLSLNSDMVQRVRSGLEKTLFQVDRPAVGINDVLAQFTEALGFATGEVKLVDPIAIEIPVDDGFLALTVKRIGLSQLDSFSLLSLLEQTGGTFGDAAPYVTKNVLKLGYDNVANANRPVKFNILFEVKNDNVIDGTDIPESQTFEATVLLTALDIDTVLEIRADPANLYPYSMNSIAQTPLYAANAVVPKPEVVAAQAPGSLQAGVRVRNLQFATTNVEVNFDCDGCALQNQIKTPEAQAALTKEIKLVLDTIAEAAIMDVATVSLNSALEVVAANCTDGLTIPLRSTPDLPSVGITVTALVNALGWGGAVLGALYVGFKSRKKAMNMSKALLKSADGINNRITGPAQLGALMRVRKSLFLDSRFSNVMKLSTVGIALVAVALMLLSNASINNSVFSRVTLVDGPQAALPSLFDVRLFSLIEGLFYFGAQEIGIATAICTAFTGYFVVATMLYCLLVPQTRLSSSSRGFILGVTNIASKLYLGEKLIVLTMIIVFDIEVVTPTAVGDGGRDTFSDIFPEDFLTITIKFLPEPGMVLYLCSIVLITILIQLVYYMHRRAEVLDFEDDMENLSNGPEDNSDTLPTSLLSSHRFVVSRDLAPVSLNMCAKVGVVAAWFGAVVCLFYGMTNKISEYKILGAAGVAMEVIAPGSSTKALSGIEYATVLSHVAQGLDTQQSLLVLCLQVFVMTGVVIAPLFILVLLGVMMFAPLALRARRACLSLLIGLFGINFIEWLAVLVFGTNFYIRSLSSLATFAICSQIDGLLEGFFVGVGLPADEATCAAAEGHVVAGWFVLLLGCILLYIAAYAITSLTKAALADQEGRSKYDPNEDTTRIREKRASRWVKLNILASPGGKLGGVIQSPHIQQYPNKQMQQQDSGFRFNGNSNANMRSVSSNPNFGSDNNFGSNNNSSSISGFNANKSGFNSNASPNSGYSNNGMASPQHQQQQQQSPFNRSFQGSTTPSMGFSDAGPDYMSDEDDDVSEFMG